MSTPDPLRESIADRRAVLLLADFGQMVSRAASPAEVLPVLATAAIEYLGVAAAAVLQVDEKRGEMTLGASAGLPEGVSIELDADLVGHEIGEAVRAAFGDRFSTSRTFPLVGPGGIFGDLVLLLRPGEELAPNAIVLAEALAGLAASALSSTAQYSALSRSYEELRASRDVLKQTHKLRALGQMAAGVAHDLKNIINPLSLHLQYLRRSLPKDAEDAQRSIVEMQAVLKRGVETIDRLRVFGRGTTSRGEATDLDRIATEAIEMARVRARTSHDVHYVFVKDLHAPPRVVVPGGDAIAAVLNLVVNAIDAMPTGGKITVSTGQDERGSWIRVADDGPGMSAEVQQRVFEPFFTTKGDEGTGLGLAMVYAFVDKARGEVKLDTAPGKGASFTLSFPSADA